MGKKANAKQPKERHVVETVNELDHDGDSKFARALGSGDFHTRDHGLSALSKWLQSQQVVDEGSLMKLWKGLLFCFWHSDKHAVQHDLAQRLAAILMLVHDQVAKLYFQTFLKTMLAEWFRIDKLRLDKFMMLIRCFFNQAFSRMALRQWEIEDVCHFTQVLQAHGFHANDSTARIGFSLHEADVYVTELNKVAQQDPGRSLTHATCMQLLRPWVAVLQTTHQPTLLMRIKQSVFEMFLALVQESSNSEKSPWVHCKPKKLAAIFSEAGAQEGVAARNRAVLYELSVAFERCGRKRKRSSNDSAVLQPPLHAVDASRLLPPQQQLQEEVKRRKGRAVGDNIELLGFGRDGIAVKRNKQRSEGQAKTQSVARLQHAMQQGSIAHDGGDRSAEQQRETKPAKLQLLEGADTGGQHQDREQKGRSKRVEGDLDAEGDKKGQNRELIVAGEADACKNEASAGASPRRERHAATREHRKQAQQPTCGAADIEKGATEPLRKGADAVERLLDRVEADLGKENEVLASHWGASAARADSVQADRAAVAEAPRDKAPQWPGSATDRASVVSDCGDSIPALAERRVEVQGDLGTDNCRGGIKGMEKKRKKRKKQSSAPDAGASTEGTGRSCRSVHGESKAPLSPEAEHALTSAMLAVQQTPPHKRRISFNLERNVVHKIGEPLPPAELRTPPSARPNGSALKKVSSLPRGEGTS